MGLFQPTLVKVLWTIILWYLLSILYFFISTCRSPIGCLPSSDSTIIMYSLLGVCSYVILSVVSYYIFPKKKKLAEDAHIHKNEVKNLSALRVVVGGYILITVFPFIEFLSRDELWIRFEALNTLIGPLIGLMSFVYAIYFIVKYHPKGNIKTYCYEILLASTYIAFSPLIITFLVMVVSLSFRAS